MVFLVSLLYLYMTTSTSLTRLIEQILSAQANKKPLRIIGGDTKKFLSNGQVVDNLLTSEHSGIISYQPSELVTTAKSGTKLSDIELELDKSNQMLAFEPPRLGSSTTIGGVVSSGLSGPSAPYRGTVRDHVLGVKLITSKGAEMRFGGEVIKNVAGYDISRLVSGAFGSLGVITEVSLRVIPKAASELSFEWGGLSYNEAQSKMLELAKKPWPITGMVWADNVLRVRVSGSYEALDDAKRRLSPSEVTSDLEYWQNLRNYSLPVMLARDDFSLWRIVLSRASDGLNEKIEWSDWGGAQRWVWAKVGHGKNIRDFCVENGGHATCFYKGVNEPSSVFTQPEPLVKKLMVRIKHGFDELRIFNPNEYFDWM
jgi:glycolate oxidase FAD binding subunit